jgi:hypothetical protein
MTFLSRSPQFTKQRIIGSSSLLLRVQVCTRKSSEVSRSSNNRSTELALKPWNNCVICEANIMVAMISRGGLKSDSRGQTWYRRPPGSEERLNLDRSEQDLSHTALSTSDTYRNEQSNIVVDNSEGRKNDKRRKKKKKNRNKEETESQPPSVHGSGEESARKSPLCLSAIQTVATISAEPLVQPPSLLSRQSVDSQDVAAKNAGSLGLSEIVKLVELKPLGRKKRNKLARQQKKSGSAEAGTVDSRVIILWTPS